MENIKKEVKMYFVVCLMGNNIEYKPFNDEKNMKDWIKEELHYFRKDVYPTKETYILSGQNFYMLLEKGTDSLLCMYKITKV